jgi:hypothetical protein
MEIFCASKLEGSERAKFLSVVSSLEPLAVVQSLGDTVTAFIKDCAERLDSRPEIPQEVKTSVKGRLLNLREESIRQALLRLTRETLRDDRDAPDLVDRAYSLRSEIIHAGLPADLDVDLERESRTISALIKRIYDSLLKTELTQAVR